MTSAATKPNGTSLGQTEVWIDRQGNEYRIDDMSVGYKANVIRFLERRAPHIVRKAVGRAVADAFISATSVVYKPVPCVQCEGHNGDGTKKIHRFEHGVDHLPYDVDKYPDETDAMVDGLWDRALAQAPKYTDAEAVELVRATPLMQRLIDDVQHGRGGDIG